jgi:hypothetical protein
MARESILVPFRGMRADMNIVAYIVGSALCLVILLLLSRLGSIKKRFGSPVFTDHEAHVRTPEGLIPSLSPYEAALLVRDEDTVIDLALTSLFLKGSLALVSTDPLKFTIEKIVSETRLPVEEALLASLTEEGRLSERGVRDFMKATALRLMEKIWFCDKTMMRRYEEDRIALRGEALEEKVKLEGIDDVLWLVLSERRPSETMISSSCLPRALLTFSADVKKAIERERRISREYSKDSLSQFMASELPAHLTVALEAAERADNPLSMLVTSGWNAIARMERHLDRCTDFSRYHILQPLRGLIAASLSSINDYQDGSEEKRLFDEFYHRYRAFLEAELDSARRRIDAEEAGLSAEEERIDFIENWRDLSPALDEKEKSLLLRRDVLRREIFSLQVQLEALSSPLKTIAGPGARSALNASLREKRESLGALTGEMDGIRIEWEKERREKGHRKKEDADRWLTAIVHVAQLKSEERSLIRNLEETAREWAIYHVLKDNALPGIVTEGEGLEPFASLVERKERHERGMLSCQRGLSTLLRFLSALEEGPGKRDTAPHESKVGKPASLSMDIESLQSLFDTLTQSPDTEMPDEMIELPLLWERRISEECTSERLERLKEPRRGD